MSSRTASEVFDQCFLEVRAKLLQLAASLDRIERAEAAEEVADDSRMRQIREGIEILAGSGFNRAERIQLVFSDQYDPDWK